MSLKTTDVKKARKHRDKELEKLYMVKTEANLARLSYMNFVEKGSEYDKALREYHPGVHGTTLTKKKLSEIRDMYVEAVNSGKSPLGVSSIKNYMRSWNKLITSTNDMRITDITTRDIAEFRKKLEEPITVTTVRGKSRIKELSARTVHNDVLNLSVIFGWAYRQEYTDKNVFDRIELPQFDKNTTKPPPLSLIDALSSIPCPSDSGFEEEEWQLLMDTFRYTGARLSEVCGLQAQNVCRVNGIPIIKVKAGKAALRRKDIFIGGYKEVPVHPAYEDLLFSRAERIKSGDMFPNAGTTDEVLNGRRETNYGHYFSRVYLTYARKIWDKMDVHSWRSYVIHYLTKVAQVPETLSEDIVGHARGSTNRDYAGRASMEILYPVIKKLP